MANIPLEDGFQDVIGKAQRGLGLSAEILAKETGLTVDQIKKAAEGEAKEDVLARMAARLNLGKKALLNLASKKYFPRTVDVPGLVQFNTTFQDMTVNAYLAFDEAGVGVAFDTGADCGSMLAFLRERKIRIELILLTHTHPDHVADLERLKRETAAPAFVGEKEKFGREAQAFAPGKNFNVGGLRIQARETSGHAPGGITYVVEGLKEKVAVVGDALFAGSMGGGAISYEQALGTNRAEIFTLPDETVICPGHGPLTTVGEEKMNNPFYPEFQKDSSGG